MENPNELRGKEQLKAIINEILDSDRFPPRWDYLNGVLTCPKILGDNELWYWFGKLLIVTPKDRRYERKSGQMQELDDWNTELDGTITLLGKKQV